MRRFLQPSDQQSGSLRCNLAAALLRPRRKFPVPRQNRTKIPCSSGTEVPQPITGNSESGFAVRPDDRISDRRAGPFGPLFWKAINHFDRDLSPKAGFGLPSAKGVHQPPASPIPTPFVPAFSSGSRSGAAWPPRTEPSVNHSDRVAGVACREGLQTNRATGATRPSPIPSAFVLSSFVSVLEWNAGRRARGRFR
jgi:hypothetical protein